MEATPKAKIATNDAIQGLLESAIQGLTADKLMFETGTLEERRLAFYDALSKGQMDRHTLSKLYQHGKFGIGMQVLADFLARVAVYIPSISLMAAEVSSESVLVWIEVKAGKADISDDLYGIEYEVNGADSAGDFVLDLLVSKAEENLTVPAHYSNIPISR